MTFICIRVNSNSIGIYPG